MFFDVDLTDKQINAYSNLISPIIEYSKTHRDLPLYEDDVQSYIVTARQTDFVLNGFLEIIDDLNYDKEKFEALIDTLDEDYENLSEFAGKLQPNIFKSHDELNKISNTILDNLVKGQFHLGAIISKNENKAS